MRSAQHTVDLAESGQLGGENPAAAIVGARAAWEAARQQVDDLTAQLNALKKASDDGARALRAVDFPLLERGAKEATDPIAAINRQYDDMAKKAEQAATGNDRLKASLRGTLDEIEKKRKADLDAAKATSAPTPAARRSSTARLPASSTLPRNIAGMSETKDRTTLKSFLGGVDPEKTAWCAAFVNAVLAPAAFTAAAAWPRRRSSISARMTRNRPSAATLSSSVEAPARRASMSAFLESIDKKGNVTVLGGNTGDKVGSGDLSANDVLASAARRRPANPPPRPTRPPTRREQRRTISPASASAEPAAAVRNWARSRSAMKRRPRSRSATSKPTMPPKRRRSPPISPTANMAKPAASWRRPARRSWPRPTTTCKSSATPPWRKIGSGMRWNRRTRRRRAK
jgi:hypothetical protein